MLNGVLNFLFHRLGLISRRVFSSLSTPKRLFSSANSRQVPHLASYDKCTPEWAVGGLQARLPTPFASYGRVHPV